MKPKAFFIGAAIMLASTVLFCFPPESRALVIPSLLFAGILGGLYVGFNRKRPLISCLYDGFKMGLPASVIQATILVLLLWFLHNQRAEGYEPLRFILLWFSGSIMLGGLVGAPFGGLLMGLFYRYLIKDRGEKELYDSYLEEKTIDKKRKDDLLD